MNKILRVLVLQSVYNGEKYLPIQLESIAEQEGVNVSLLVRDDGSKDSTESIIHVYANKMPITYHKEANIGAAKSFMRLIELAADEYDYFAFADQDDYWEKDKLYVAVSKLEGNDEIPALYYSCTKRVGPNLEEIKNPYKKHYHTENFPDVLIMTGAPGCTMVFNKKLLILLKKYIPAQIYMHDQWVLQVCAAVGGKIVYDKHSHMLYRQHAGNVVSGLEKMNYNPFQLFIYRVGKFLNFSYRPSFTAAELKKGYFDLMDDKNRKLIQIFVGAPHQLKYRLYILLSNKIGVPYWIYNVKFKLQTLLNRI